MPSKRGAAPKALARSTQPKVRAWILYKETHPVGYGRQTLLWSGVGRGVGVNL